MKEYRYINYQIVALDHRGYNVIEKTDVLKIDITERDGVYYYPSDLEEVAYNIFGDLKTPKEKTIVILGAVTFLVDEGDNYE